MYVRAKNIWKSISARLEDCQKFHGESLIGIPLSLKYGLVMPSVKILKVESF